MPLINNDSKKIMFAKGLFRRLTYRKTMDSLEPSVHIRYELRPNALNFIHLVGIGVGGTIGTGIFSLSGKAAARYAGPSVIISFILSGIVALLSALSFAELSSLVNSPGSAYTYAYIALGEFCAFLVGWSYVILYQLAGSAVMVDWSRYLVDFIDIISDYNATRSVVVAPVAWSEDNNNFYVTGGAINLPAIAITLIITVILIIGIRETSYFNLVLVVFKLIVLLIFIFAGCVYVKKTNYQPFIPPNKGSFNNFGATGMLRATSYVFFGYIGFETVSTVNKEAKYSSRSVPYATIVSLLITILFYIGVSTVMVGLAPYENLDDSNSLNEAVKGTPYGRWLLIVLDLGAIASLTTVALTILLAQTRIFYAMAEDGLLPKWFKTLSAKRNTPWKGTLFCGGLCALLSGICPVDIIGEAASMTALIIYLFTHICVIVMRYTHEGLYRAVRVPFSRWLLPVIGSIVCILLLASMTKGTPIRYFIIMGVGVIFYFVYSFRSAERTRKGALHAGSTMELTANNEGNVTPSVPVMKLPTFKEEPMIF